MNQLFDFLRSGEPVRSADWARLGNALNQFSDSENSAELRKFGIDPTEARLFAATAFYCGSYCAFEAKAKASAFEAYLKTGSDRAFRKRHFA